MKYIKVLHVVGFLGYGGDTTAIMNVKNYIDKSKLNVKFDFITHDGCDRKLVEFLKKEGSHVYILSGDVRKIGIVKYFLEIRKILNVNQYDAIHFHTSFQSVVGLLAAAICRVKIRICHSHTTDIQRKTNKLKRYLYLPICRFFINIFATKKIGCSKIANDFLFGKRDDSLVIYNGLDIDKLKKTNEIEISKIIQKYHLNKYDKIIGQVGRINDMKNPLFTLEIAKKLKNNNYAFIYVGTGSLIDELKEEIERYKLDNVFVTGFVNNVNDFMSIFDYLLLPSKYGEGLPVVLIEQQIINPNCICISNNNVTKESNIGAVKYIDIKNQDEWIDLLSKKVSSIANIDYKLFDINTTAKKWLNLYLTRK